MVYVRMTCISNGSSNHVRRNSKVGLGERCRVPLALLVVVRVVVHECGAEVTNERAGRCSRRAWGEQLGRRAGRIYTAGCGAQTPPHSRA
jgi:hypothetical protein